MEIKEAVMKSAAVSFSRDTEECQLSLPVANDTGVESDIDIENENPMTSSKEQEGGVSHCLSGLYADVLIAIAGVSVLTEILHKNLPLFYIHDYIFLYIFGMGILLLIGAYVKQCCVHFNHFSKNEDNNCSTPKSIHQRPAFDDISPYLKIGGFMFGSIVIFVTSLEIFSIFVSPEKCIGSVSACSPILRCVFISLQICFLKNPNDILRHFGGLPEFALMHLFAANAATWIRLFLWESARDWEDAFHIMHNSSVNWSKHVFNFTVHSLESDSKAEDATKHYPTHVVHYTSNCWWRVQKFEETMDVLSVSYCLQNSPVGYFWGEASRFLYPFLAQYYFVITGLLYVLWLNFNVKGKHREFVTQNTSKEADMCRRSTKGILLGCIIFVVTILIVILFFTVQKNLDMAIYLVHLIIFISSSFASLLGILQIKKMLNFHSIHDIHFTKLLQEIGLFALLVYGTCSLIFEAASEDERSVLCTFSVVGMIIHGCTQYVFILQISRKKVDVSNFRMKPGRQAVAFLILCNLSLWLLDCFVNWNNLKQSKKVVFDDPLWPLVTRCLLPVVTFHRFHSIVTLVEIWSRTYK